MSRRSISKLKTYDEVIKLNCTNRYLMIKNQSCVSWTFTKNWKVLPLKVLLCDFWHFHYSNILIGTLLMHLVI